MYSSVMEEDAARAFLKLLSDQELEAFSDYLRREREDRVRIRMENKQIPGLDAGEISCLMDGRHGSSNYSSHRIDTIKLYRARTGCGLLEAKIVVDDADERLKND